MKPFLFLLLAIHEMLVQSFFFLLFSKVLKLFVEIVELKIQPFTLDWIRKRALVDSPWLNEEKIFQWTVSFFSTMISLDKSPCFVSILFYSTKNRDCYSQKVLLTYWYLVLPLSILLQQNTIKIRQIWLIIKLLAAVISQLLFIFIMRITQTGG